MGEGILKRSAGEFEHFDTILMGAADCGYIMSTKKSAKKVDFTGVKIAWVDMKSNQYP